MEIEKEQLGVPKSVQRQSETLIFEDVGRHRKKENTSMCKVCESKHARKLHTYATFVLSKTETNPPYPASSIDKIEVGMEVGKRVWSRRLERNAYF